MSSHPIGFTINICLGLATIDKNKYSNGKTKSIFEVYKIHFCLILLSLGLSCALVIPALGSPDLTGWLYLEVFPSANG